MIRFSQYIWVYFLISALVIVPGIFSLVVWKFSPSIDFTGGTIMEVQAPMIDPPQLMQIAREQGVEIAGVQKSGDDRIVLRFKPSNSEALVAFEKTLESTASKAYTILRTETVGPVLGKELLYKAVVAAFLAIFGILAYVAYAFKNIRFGVSAILALFHDLLVVLGSFSLLGHFFGVEVDTLFVTAFLTTMSFSVHDTIVVFDRIREYQKRGMKESFEEISNKALNETMGRSLTNSFTIIFMLVALLFFGGDTVRWFVVALLIGTVSGTYSSPFVATPILMLWDAWSNRQKINKTN